MDEEKLRVCRRCFLRESGEEDVLAQIREKISALPAAEKADDETYRQRLSVCGGCDSLVGGTCMKCGCYPEFRAAFRRRGCPERKWPDGGGGRRSGA